MTVISDKIFYYTPEGKYSYERWCMQYDDELADMYDYMLQYFYRTPFFQNVSFDDFTLFMYKKSSKYIEKY